MITQRQARMLKAFREASARLGLLSPRARVLAAVSGGGDSMAMLHLLAEHLPMGRLSVAHVDHRARPGSARDAAFVRAQAKRLGLSCRILRLPAWRKPPSEGELREGRYAALSRFRFTHLATAHTADDQAETVLLRIARGTGLSGLAGIPEERRQGRLRIVRPLLGVSREELRAYLQRRRIPFREDPTNRRLAFARNRVRRKVLPELEAIHPGVREALVRLAGQARQAAAFLSESGEAAAKRVLKGGRVSRARMRALPASLRAEVWKRAHARLTPGRGLESDHLKDLEALLAFGKGEVSLPGRVSVCRLGSLLTFRSGPGG